METVDNKQFYIVGNNLSLDFINTKIAVNGEPKDLLTSVRDFISWSFELNLLDESQRQKLIENTVDNEKAFAKIIDFRESLRHLVEVLRKSGTAQNVQIQAINQILQTNSGFVEIVKSENGFEKKLHANFDEPSKLLLPIAESAADLLCFGNFDYLRKCENESCVLHFYDTTKNHKRRWCSMSGCGNRAKAAAFYQRKKAKID